MIDLHCHTKISDNNLTIKEVLTLAKKRGLSHLAITDHDTTKGLIEAFNLGKEMGIEVIPGIEISAYDFKRQKRAHILGFYVEPGNQAIEKLCSPLAQKRQNASVEMINRLIAAGFDISREQVEKYAEGGTGIYKQHIMHALIDKGYCEGIYSPLYKKLFSRGNGTTPPGMAFIELEYINMFEAIYAIRSAGGVAVLAHPAQLGNFDAIEELVDFGLQGIEAFHPSHNEEDTLKAVSLAKEFKLCITGGSDFHGFYEEPAQELGCEKLGIEVIEQLNSLKKGGDSK